MKRYLIFLFMIGICSAELFTLTHNGASRIYWVDYPENSIEPAPLVISMHGRNQSLYSQIYQSEMSSFANPQNIASTYDGISIAPRLVSSHPDNASTTPSQTALTMNLSLIHI